MTVTSDRSPAIELLEELRSGGLSARAAVEAAIERCRQAAALNALISLRADPALAEADAADARRLAGHPLGTLHGLPIVVKDNIAVGGWQFTGGSPAFEAYVAPADAAVVARLRAEGAIVVGKANLHEFAFGTTNNNGHFGPARNPHDPSRICGGSSGGSAASVAGGLVAVALASDTGGSGRIPAALCGCVGFRPTKGRYSGDGVLVLSTTRDTITTMAHSVADIVLLDQVITGAIGVEAPAAGTIRLGVLAPFAVETIAPEVRSAFEAGLDLLERAGVEVVQVDGTELSEIDQEIGLGVATAEASRYWRDYAPSILGIDFPDFVERLGSPDVKRIFRTFGNPEHEVPAAVYARFVTERLPRLRAAYSELFVASGVDAFVFPTVPVTAPPIGQDDTLHIEGQDLPLFPTTIRNTGPGSLAGIPGISLPLPVATGQLPVGLALDASAGADAALLGLAATVERVLAAGQDIKG